MIAITVLIEWLISNGLATEEDVDVFRNYIPDDPDRVIAVMEYNGGQTSMWTDVSLHNIQIFVRGSIDVEPTIWNIYGTLKSQTPFLSVPGHCCLITMKGTPFAIKQDDRGRFEWVFNLGMTINN